MWVWHTLTFFLKCLIRLGTRIQYFGCRDNKLGEIFKIVLNRTRLGLHGIAFSISFPNCPKPLFSQVHVFDSWNLRILFVKLSAHFSLSRSRVGYKSRSFSISSQSLSLSVTTHWWSGVISASQFKHLDFSGGSGVNTRGAGEGRPFVHGEIGEGEFSGQGGLLSIYFSGDSISLSPTWMSDLILCAKGGREGTWRVR